MFKFVIFAAFLALSAAAPRPGAISAYDYIAPVYNGYAAPAAVSYNAAPVLAGYGAYGGAYGYGYSGVPLAYY